MMCYFLHITRQTKFRHRVILVGATVTCSLMFTR